MVGAAEQKVVVEGLKESVAEQKASITRLATKDSVEASIAHLATKAELAASIVPLATKADIAPLAIKADTASSIAPLVTTEFLKKSFKTMNTKITIWFLVMLVLIAILSVLIGIQTLVQKDQKVVHIISL